MQKNTKLIKFLIAAIMFIALVTIFYQPADTAKKRESVPEASSSEDAGSQTGEGQPEIPASDAGAGEATAPGVGESTPQERATRTVTPSDAASYSEEDLPAEFE